MLGKFVNLFNQEGGSFTIPTLLSIFFPKLSRGISEEQMLWIAIIVRFNAKQNIQLCRWTVKAMKLWQTSSNCLFWQSKSKNWVQTCWPRRQLPDESWTKLPAITNCLHTQVNLVFVGLWEYHTNFVDEAQIFRMSCDLQTKLPGTYEILRYRSVFTL